MIYDVSLGIGPDMLTWPGDPPVEVDPARRLAKGDPANVSELRLGTHTGTHVDPPFHFIDGGRTAEALDLTVLVGPALVADLRHAGPSITPAEMNALAVPEGTERILFRTPNSELWGRTPVRFPDTYTALTPEGARWCIDRGIRLVGTDFLSIERKGTPGHPTHVTLLEAGVIILEGLDLSAVEPGAYELSVLPLKILGGDGAPARAILRSL
ncbi:MAG: cyclase family protein [Actinobacteria bacterium]|nr:MAG: cyclase family protein [Actinomycetota bacterium]